MPKIEIAWPHAPRHLLGEAGIYFVTAATYTKAHHFRGADRLAVLHRGLLRVASDFGWQLEARAVFSNHYHFIARNPTNGDDASSLSAMISALHTKTARWINKLDDTTNREVWHNYWETALTHQRSYFARLNYVHQNAVKHGLVPVANQYPWCSAGWLERTASAAQVRTIHRFKTDKLKIDDDYEPVSEW
ncbi:MAG: transposase [Verrucomicrobiaceae bacterium]